jgi:hypothetical protein
MHFRPFRWFAVATCAFVLGSANANILVNPGFETGDLTGWVTTGFSVTNSDKHSGVFSVLGNGNVNVQQTFTPVATSLITEVSVWIRQPNSGGSFINAFDLIYSDGTTDEFVPQPPNPLTWTKEDFTANLRVGKSLSSIRAWGYSQGTQNDLTSYDDFTVNAAVPEPASMAVLGMGAIAFIRKRRLSK